MKHPMFAKDAEDMRGHPMVDGITIILIIIIIIIDHYYYYYYYHYQQ